MLKELKGTRTISHQIDYQLKMEITRKNEIEILELKNTIIEMKNS